MAPKKSTTEQQTPVVAAPATTVASAPVVAEKPKKSKKTEKTQEQAVSPSPVVTSSAPVVSTPAAAPVVAEKPKKSKKTEKTQEQVAVPVPETETEQPQQVSESEKPKKVSKKKVKSEESTEVSSEVSSESQSVQAEPKKRASKKSSKSEVSSETASETSSEVSSETTESSEVPEKRVRKVVNQETLKVDVEQLKQQVEGEIQRLRTDQQKNKGVKFLKAVNKALKSLSGDLNRVLKSKTKTTRNKNTSSGFMKPVKISSEMALFTSWDHSMLYSRVDVTKYLCNYIKTNSLQNPEDKRQILCDEKLASLLKVDVNSETPLTYPGLQQHIQQHFIADTSSVSEEVAQP